MSRRGFLDSMGNEPFRMVLTKDPLVTRYCVKSLASPTLTDKKVFNQKLKLVLSVLFRRTWTR